MKRILALLLCAAALIGLCACSPAVEQGETPVQRAEEWLGVPFVLCALLIDRLKGALAAVKRHYAVVNRVCGAFLVLVGVLMMTGLFARLSALLS